MALASVEDINLHLPDDKLEVSHARYPAFQLDAERIVRGSFAGFWPATVLASWTTPDNVPGLIRAIAGRLVAAFYYRYRYSEEGIGDPEYAQFKYNEAMAFIQKIISGEMVVEEVLDVPTAGHSLSELDFWPNDSTPGPVFTVDMIP
jgi:hypothetical protein